MNDNNYCPNCGQKLGTPEPKTATELVEAIKHEFHNDADEDKMEGWLNRLGEIAKQKNTMKYRFSSI